MDGNDPEVVPSGNEEILALNPIVPMTMKENGNSSMAQMHDNSDVDLSAVRTENKGESVSQAEEMLALLGGASQEQFGVGVGTM